jgi:murein L,D-transpeptidase YcbB/YkuD
MVNNVKTPHNRKLLYTSLLAFLSLQTYTGNNYAVEATPTTVAAPTAPTVPATLPTPPAAIPVAPLNTHDIIAQTIKGMIASTVWEKEATTEIYRLSDNKLVWLNNKNTEAALKLLNETAQSRGLHSEDYNVQWLNSNWQQLKNTPDPSFEQLARFDTNLSNSVLSYFSDLRYGRVNPKKVRFDFEVNKEHLKLAQGVFNAAKDGSFSTFADTLEPKIVFYRNLKKALNQYQQAAREHKDLHFKFHGLKEGQSDPQIVELRQLLTTLGDITPGKDTKNAKSEIYDAALAAGVKNFQHRHHLAGNGTLNKETTSALNVPLADRISQIELSLERLRWVPEYAEDRLVLVNIPSFQLWAFDSLKDEKSKPLSMRVVVGKAAGTKTPSFSSKMDNVEFRPTWSVPQSIIKNEMMSKLEDNPEYFSRRNMKVTYHNNGQVSIRQASGDHNALGLVKFLFPNNHSVYFHDTPSKQFFNRDRRDFSHGCVRVSQPAQLAEFVLKKQKEAWTDEKIKKAMHRGGSRRVPLEAPIPVIIYYGTALALDSTGVSFYQDVYGHDKTLKHVLLQTKKTENVAKAK